MLMQIAEPGQSTIKEACKARVVGIDLGTTNSLVAHVADSSPAVLGDDPLLPSVVFYGKGGEIVVGRAAQARALEAPKETLASVKRLIGRGLTDIASVRSMLPYELAGDDRAVRVVVGTREVSPVEVSAEILEGRLEGAPQVVLGVADRGCGDHRAGVLRRCPAPGHARCRAGLRGSRSCA